MTQKIVVASDRKEVTATPLGTITSTMKVNVNDVTQYNSNK